MGESPRVEIKIEPSSHPAAGHWPGRIVGGDGPLLIDGTGFTTRHLVDSGGVSLMTEGKDGWRVNFEGDWAAFVALAKDILCNEEAGYGRATEGAESD